MCVCTYIFIDDKQFGNQSHNINTHKQQKININKIVSSAIIRHT